MALQIRRGTDAERLTITPAEGELIYTTDTRLIYVGDGSTVGGTKADSGITDLLSDTSPQLGGNLDLNTQTITGTGQINITGNITGTVISGNSGNFTSSVIGSLQASSVQGDLTGSVFANDSTMLVDGTDGKLVLSNNNIQDLSNVYVPSTPSGGDALIWNAVDSRWEAGNVSVAGGVFDGDMQGSVFGDDSTLIVDGVNNSLYGNLFSTIITTVNDEKLTIKNGPTTNASTIVDIGTLNNRSLIQLSREDDLIDMSGSYDLLPIAGTTTYQARVWNGDTALLGQIDFRGSDTSNPTLREFAEISAHNNRLTLIHTSDGTFDFSKTLRLSDGFVTIGDSPAIQRLTIQGGIHANGRIYASAGFEGSIVANDSTIFFDADTSVAQVRTVYAQDVYSFNTTLKGQLSANSVFASQIQGDIIADDSTTIIDSSNGTITAGGFIQFGSYNTTERNALSAANGMVIYNSQANRFQGYQNGAWINIDDGTAA